MPLSHQEVMRRIRDAVLECRYIVTPHAWMEMREDDLIVADIESALLGGRIAEEYRDDPRGTRYRVLGIATDLDTPVAVVVRFVVEGQLLVITTFVPKADAET